MLAVSSIIDTKHVGENTTVGYFSHILSGARVGKNCVIGDHVVITHNTVIGDNVFVGNGSTFGGTEARSRLNKREGKECTVIEDDVVIGNGVRVVGNTTIKRGAIVGDGSTVIGYVWAGTFVAGNPARKFYSISSVQ